MGDVPDGSAGRVGRDRPMKRYNDIKGALDFAARVAFEEGIPLKRLLMMLYESYGEADKIGKKRRSN
jgi:hypothetical protein